VIYLIGVRNLTLTETVLMASIATVVQAVWRPKRRPQALKMGAGISALVVAYSPVVGWETALAMLPGAYLISVSRRICPRAREANS